MTARSRIAVVVKGYPRLSETFVAQEILALERWGLELTVVSLRRPHDAEVHPIHRRIRAGILYLPEYLHREPARLVRAWARARRLKGFAAARRSWLRDLGRDPTRNRWRRFGQACVAAAELPASVSHLHAHFLHTPASVARYAARMRALPWSVSAHAKDIWTTPDWDKREKLAEMDWLVTCTAYGRDHLAGYTPEEEKVELLYHGLDFDRLPAPPPARPRRDGADPRDPVRLLSVGRMVEKKGYGDLLTALAALPAELSWSFTHVGGGALEAVLKRQARDLGLGDRVRWLGPQAHDAVLERYAEADLFVLASRIAADGDRDGLPNVLMEAQSQALACLSTRLAGIPELIRDRETGVLVPPGDPAALAEALARLIREPDLRRRLGLAGNARVRGGFSCQRGIDRLVRRLAAAGRADTGP